MFKALWIKLLHIIKVSNQTHNLPNIIYKKINEAAICLNAREAGNKKVVVEIGEFRKLKFLFINIYY